MNIAQNCTVTQRFLATGSTDELIRPKCEVDVIVALEVSASVRASPTTFINGHCSAEGLAHATATGVDRLRSRLYGEIIRDGQRLEILMREYVYSLGMPVSARSDAWRVNARAVEDEMNEIIARLQTAGAEPA